MREKLIELLSVPTCPSAICNFCRHFKDSYGCEKQKKEMLADHLIQNGVTIQKWIPVTERLPQRWVSVLGYMTDAGEFPPVRECFVTMKDEFYFPALSETHPVSHWTPLPEPPKEVE